jgi:hypothetical protein
LLWSNARREDHQMAGRAGTKRPAKRGRKPGTFQRGFDPRRNLKGAVPGVFDLKKQILRDGALYVDQLFRLAMKGDSSAVKYALDHSIGTPAVNIRVEEELRAALERLKASLKAEEYERIVAILAAPPSDS